MKNRLRVEGIPAPGAKVYSTLVARSLLARELYREIAEEVALRLPSGRILDVGTGPGCLPLELAKRSRSLKIIGVDVSAAMVRIAVKNAENEKLSGSVTFEIADAADLPFNEGYFDFVVSTFSFHHWSSPLESIRQIHRVLKQNGRAWIYDLRRDVTREDRELMRSKYGPFWEFMVSNLVRPHSSVTLGKVMDILSSPESPFLKKSVEDMGGFLRIRLSK